MRTAPLWIVVVGFLLGRPAMAESVAEPVWTPVQTVQDIEVRRYAPVVRAVTVVEGTSWDGAMNEGFRRLAGYIFGGNTTRASIAMTAPVSAQPVPSQPTSQKIAMTAPVTASPGPDGAIRVTFTMPAGETLSSLPEPNDPRVVLEAMPERLVAVRRFSGFAGEAKMRRERAALLDGLAALGLKATAEPELARYDAPWTLPFLRRNEITVDVISRAL